MNVDNLKLPAECIDFIKSYGASQLYPPQEMAIQAGLLDGSSMMVSAPTASGKTLTAMMGIMAAMLRGCRRVVYLSPLRALAAEKHHEFSQMSTLPMDIRPSISTGEPSTSSRPRGNLLTMTNERMDVAIRRGSSWLEEVDLVIADEIHLIGDKHRGPTLEMILTRLNDTRRQMLGLSATIHNAAELARWLNCPLVHSEWRPVKLLEGVCCDGSVSMDDNTVFDVQSSSRGAAVELALQTVLDGHQAIIFVNTRRGAPSQAKRASKRVSRMLRDDEAARLANIAESIQRQGGGAPLVENLASLVRSGVAFHHAGLDPTSRRIIESSFRDGHIRLMAATTTLAAGVNLPARRVVISNITRYNSDVGRNTPISVMEYKQLCGRAGRPQYDTVGEAITVTNAYPDDIMDEYVRGTPEPITSGIDGSGPMLMHTLGLVVSQPQISTDDIHGFFGRTLGGRQRGPHITHDVDQALMRLAELEMIHPRKDIWRVTPLGRLVSRLYIAPVTARSFLDILQAANPRSKDHTLGLLHAISYSSEFQPVMALRDKEQDAAQSLLRRRSEMIHSLNIYDISRSLLGLYWWIDEQPHDIISKQCGIEPGDSRRMAETGSWLARCMADLADYAGLEGIRQELHILRTRIIHGVRADIAPLMSIRNVGRVRGRALHAAGADTIQAVAAMDVDEISAVCKVGHTMARRIKAAAAS